MHQLADYHLRVYYEDTDAGGVVYHANYLKYCERARSQFLIGVADFEKQQNLPSSTDSHVYVVKAIKCEFVRAARLFDELQVASKIKQIGKSSLVFEQTCYKSEQALFTAEVVVVCVNSQFFKPTRIPQSHLDFLHSSYAS